MVGGQVVMLISMHVITDNSESSCSETLITQKVSSHSDITFGLLVIIIIIVSF